MPLPQLVPVQGPRLTRRRQQAVELFELEASRERFSGTAETWDLCAVRCGSGVFQYRNTRYETATGSVLLKEPGEWFATPKVLQPMAYAIIRLQSAEVLPLLSPIAKNPHLCIGQHRDPRLFRLICAAHARLSLPQLGRLECDSIVQLLITELFATSLESRRPPPPRLDRRRIRWVRDFIEAHYDQELSLSALSRAAGLHEVYIVRAFRELYGIPPHAYQLRRRVLEARKHLDAGLPPAQASLAVGFYDQSHLNRHFKRVLGLTPGKYQRCLRAL